MAELTAKLTPSTSKMVPRKIQWEPAMVEAFHKLCESLVNVCMLTIPSPDDEFTLHTDASLLVVGGVLHVLRADEELPVGYHARQLRGSKLNYSVTKLEALAVISTVEHFAHYLFGKKLQDLLGSQGFGEFAVIQDAKQTPSVDSTEAATVELYYHLTSRT